MVSDMRDWKVNFSRNRQLRLEQSDNPIQSTIQRVRDFGAKRFVRISPDEPHKIILEPGVKQSCYSLVPGHGSGWPDDRAVFPDVQNPGALQSFAI